MRLTRLFLSALLLSTLLPACSGSDQSGTDSPGGKADDLGSSQTECSYSEELDFAHLFSGAITSETLAGVIAGGKTVTRDDVADLTALEEEQIFAAVVHLQLLDGSEEFSAAFEASDDEMFELLDLEVEDLSGDTDYFFAGTWIRFYAGDTEVGVIYEAGTGTIVAEVSDGDVMGCTASRSDDGASEVDCTARLLDDYSRDSALHTVNIDDFENDTSEMTLPVALEAIALVGEQLGCDASDSALAIDDAATCSEIAQDAPWSTTCYLPSAAGFYLVSTDYVETINVLFNRWD